LAKLDEKAIVKVKTPSGETEMFELQKLIIQGGVFSPIKCTVQIDTLGRDCIKYNEGLYKYKNTINVPPLSLIDDVVAVTKSGTDTILMNAKINMKMESKKLRLSADKCKHIHIARKKTESLINLKVHNQKIKKSESCSYLGDRLSSDGTLDLTIAHRRKTTERSWPCHTNHRDGEPVKLWTFLLQNRMHFSQLYECEWYPYQFRNLV
jgi:hypothetical protein